MFDVYIRKSVGDCLEDTWSVKVLAVTMLIGIMVFQMQAVFFMRGTAENELVAVGDMVSPLLAYSRVQGEVDEQRSVALSIGLRPQNQLRLHSYIRDILQTNSVNYHHFLTSGQYADEFSPAETVYDELSRFLEAGGFTVTHTYNHRLLIDFSGTIGQVERVFHVKIRSYVGPDGSSYYANDGNPVMPARFAGQVLGINGLNNALRWHSGGVSRRLLGAPGVDTGGARGRSSRVVCPGRNRQYLMPDQFAAAYDLNGLYRAGYQGEGQTIALFELSPFASSDITTYTSCFGHSRTSIQVIPIGKGLLQDDGVMEVEMDAELILSAAPRLSKLKIYEAANDATSYLAQWARIVQDAPAVVSTSWGLCEQTLEASLIKEENALFTAAAAQGQSIFASTGDTGSAGCFGDSPALSKVLEVNDPAAQPFVTGVGGSSLTLKGAGEYDSEAVWNTTKKPQASYSGASGGGISHYWRRPAWQKMVGVRNGYSTGRVCGARGSNTCRETPDVSLHADTDRGYIIYCSAKATKSCSDRLPWNVVGGTSVATPLWAVLAALTNQMLQKQEGGRLGFINPLLYQIAGDPQKYRACFHDVTKGNNDYRGMNGGRYAAGVGYDMATGLGSYNAYALARGLVEQAKLRKGKT